MMIDPTDAIADARDGLDRAAGAFARAQARTDIATGKDASGEVVVCARPDGSLDDVVIGSMWSHEVPPEEIGAAVMAAYADATTKVLNQWGEAVVEEGGRPGLRPMPDVSTSLHARLNELTDPAVVAENSDDVLGRLADFLTEMNNELDDVSAEAEAVAAAASVGTSRAVTVSVNGVGTVVDVQIDADAAARTSGNSLAQDVLRAYKAASRQARTRTVEDVIAGSRVGELQRLANDPRALAERFGLA